MAFFRKYKTAEELLPGFLLEKEIGISHKTYTTYSGQLPVFTDWLKENGYGNLTIRKITPEVISDFFYYLGRDKGLDKPTCEKYCMNIKQLFNYAEKRGELEFMPFDLVVFPRKKKDQGAEVIQHEDLKVLLPEIQRVDPQLYLACMIQYYCFIRPGKELRLLKIGDVDLRQGIITVRQDIAKNKLRQSVTMPQQLIDICIEHDIDKVDKSLFIFGCKGMLYIKALNNSIEDGLENSLRKGTKGVLQEISLYTSDKITTDNKKALTYTKDILTAVLSGTAITYDVNNYVALGIKKTSKPMFTLRIDDGLGDCYTNWKPLFDSYGIKVSSTILTGLIGTAGIMTWSQVVALYNDNWEITLHGIDGTDLGDGTYAAAETAIITGKATLEGQGIPVKNFTPQGYGQDAMFVREIASKYFNSSHAGFTMAPPEGSNEAVIDIWNIRAMRGDLSGTYMLDSAEGIAAIKAQLDLCVSGNRWAILYIHGYTAAKGAGLIEIIEYAQAAGIEFVTIQQGLDNRKYL